MYHIAGDARRGRGAVDASKRNIATEAETREGRDDEDDSDGEQ